MNSDRNIRLYVLRKGISPTILFWGWDVSTINPTLEKDLGSWGVIERLVMYTKSSGATHCGKILWPGPYRRPFVLISSFARHSD